MKNVWVLERFIDIKEMQETLLKNEELLLTCDTDEQKQVIEEIIAAYKNRMAEHPNGYWLGYEGKTKYKDFCFVAKEFLRRNHFPNAKLRVVKAQIEDAAKYWVGYTNPIINEGVMKYLYATYK